MAKSKHGPALFEVLQAEQAKGLRELDPARAPTTDDSALRKDRSAWDRVRSSSSQIPDRTVEEQAAPPFFRHDGPQITLTLTTQRCAIAIFVGLTVLAFAYALGDRFGKAGFRQGYEAGRNAALPAPEDELELVRSQTPATHLLEGILVDSNQKAGRNPTAPSPAPTGTIAAGWIEGYNYVVVQEFAANATEPASKAAKFLEGRGIPTALVRPASGRIHLITTQGFNLKDATQKQLAEQFLEKVHRAGADYYASGGGYRLKGYLKTFKGENW